MAPSFLGMSSALRCGDGPRLSAVWSGRTVFWPCCVLLGPPGPAHAALAYDSGRENRKGILRSVSWSRTRTPERRPGRTQQTGRRRVYSTPRPGASRPGYKTPRGAQLFPVTLRTAVYGPDPRERDQRPPGEPGAAADHGGDRPDGDQRGRHRRPYAHGHRPRGEPSRAVAAQVGRQQRLPEVRRSAPQRGVGQLVQVDGGQVRQQFVELP